MTRTLALLLACVLTATAFADPPAPADPVIDSAMTEAEAFDGLSPKCPQDIRDRQRLVAVTYVGFDGRDHRGQVVVDRDLVEDIEAVFAVALREKFPIESVVPISLPKFRKAGAWDDDASMAANNTSAFNYRLVTGGATLSNHATGRAIDINPVQNPYIRGKAKPLPPGSVYRVSERGTLTADHPVTKAFVARGWTWGGNWTTTVDYQHFEKPLKKSE